MTAVLDTLGVTLLVLLMAAGFVLIAMFSLAAGVCYTVGWLFRSASERIERWMGL